ncbi:MAG: carboxypeptidase-like regulatory domain-containing protein [Flavobacteriaceae bacterium]|nr:carboxypeptidase-like regulatory domain-containing protein [Flavobacteriaceae bacterium]
MKKKLLLFFLLITTISYSQIRIHGKVLSFDNSPLVGASVYLNNTTIGVSTKNDGTFEFFTKEGIYELIVSYLGHKTVNYNLNTKTFNKPLRFKLEEDDMVLNEVVIRKTYYNEKWRSNLKVFKENFLGRTKLAKQANILNPKTLHFEYDISTETLTATAREPLKIEHKGLGYLITFDLVHFSLDRYKLNYLGYTKFKNLTGSKRKQRRWKKNRLKAYLGSRMHFVRSLLNKTTTEEGFIIHQFRREKNKERPSDKEINTARKLAKLYPIMNLNLSKKIQKPKTSLDSIIVVLQKSNYPKFKDYLYKKNVPPAGVIKTTSNKILLSFDNFLSVIYTKEKEEENYVRGPFGRIRKPLKVQTSYIVLLAKDVELDKTGEVINPLAIHYEGYWAFEQFADALPLNYQPK